MRFDRFPALMASLALLLPMTVSAEMEVVSAIDNVPTFVRGELGFIDSLSTKSLDSAADEASLQLSAKGFLQELVAESFGADGTEDMVPTSLTQDELGMVHVRFDQYIDDMRVVGANLVIHADATSGAVYAVNGNFVSAASIPVRGNLQPLPSASLAKAMGAEGRVIEEAEPSYLLSQDGNKALLVWKMRVEVDNKEGYSNDWLFFDAMTGELVDRHPTVYHAKSRRTHTANNGTTLPGTLLCSNGASCGDAVAQTAHDNAGITYDYYSARHGRDSLNGSGFLLRSTVHYRSNYNNAFWTGSQMVYGDGDGNRFAPLGNSLDVVAHELTHGVTEFTSNLIYNRESGGINEALSDIFGAATEIYSVGSINADSWRLGEDIFTPNGSSTDALRYLNNPTLDNYSKDYYPERLYPGFCSPSSNNDQCGVHGNSGIANLGFYLMVQGGTHPRGKTSVNVPAIGLTKAEKIFYRAQTNYLTSSSNFQALRTATAQAAQDLYGTTEVDAVHDAWCAVGVPGCPGTGGPPAANSCEGRCGNQAPAGCWCDSQCAGFGDCCPDKVAQCG